MIKSNLSTVAGLALALTVIAAALLILTPGEPVEEVEGEMEQAIREPRPESKSSDPVSSGDAIESSGEPKSPVGLAENAREEIKSSSIPLSGAVTDLKSGKPVEEFEIRLDKLDGQRWNKVGRETVRHPLGEFRFLLDAGGKHRVSVRASRYLPCTHNEIDIPHGSGLRDLIIALDPGIIIQGKVVDYFSGAPVAEALVGPVTSAASTHFKETLSGKESRWNHDMTDEQGLFELYALTGDFPNIVAVHPDYTEGRVSLDFNKKQEVEIRMKAGPRIYGNAFDDQGDPAAGIFITLSGGGNLMHRTVVTSTDGSFRLPPANPGHVDVTAEASSWSRVSNFGFTRESKSVELVDKDVEIYFGPFREHITWRGRIFDCDAQPVSGAQLTITPIRVASSYIYRATKYSRNARCNNKGEFEVGKLYPDEYAVQIRHHETGHKIDWGTIVLDQPGVIERDIHIVGGVIKGTIVDAETRDPLVGVGGFISGRPRTSGYRSFTTNISHNGRFVLQGLPPAKYKLDARAKGYPPAGMELTLGQNERIENLILPVASGGTMLMRFTGFEKTDSRECEVNWSRDGGQGWHSSFSIDESGSDEVSFVIDTGRWFLDVTFQGCGVVKKEFIIHPNETTEIVIERKEVKPEEGKLNAQVKLSWEDGSPAGNIEVRFFAMEETRMRTTETYIFGTTDPGGRIDLTGFVPGPWRFMAVMPDGGEAELPRVDIAPGSSSPYIIDVVIPSGEIRGVFHDSLSGKPFGETEPRWWVHLFDDIEEDYITAIRHGRGSRFRLFGVNGGRYKLKLRARGYRSQETHLFDLAEGQKLDLGRIEMTPLGTLDLKVVDRYGKSIKYYNLSCPGRQTDVSSWWGVQGRKFESGFPLGKCTITISADGYREKEFHVHFEPGVVKPMQIVLDEK